MHKPELTAGYLSVWWILRVLSTHALYLTLTYISSMYVEVENVKDLHFAKLLSLYISSSLGTCNRLVPVIYKM